MKMLRKLPFIIISKVRNCERVFVRNSALFINGVKATETFVYVTPHVEFPEQIKNKNIIQEHLVKRKSNIDLHRIENLWTVYQELKKRKHEFETKKDEISKELGKVIKTKPDSDLTKQLQIQISLVKDNIRKLKSPLYSAEEAAMVEALKLPNALHFLTPNENKIIFTYSTPPTCKKDHLKIGTDLNIIKFKKNENYYLKGDAALFELGAKFYFNKTLKKNNFVQFSNPDFVKSVIVEGCGEDHTDPDKSFILHHNDESKANVDNRLHLTGGGSLTSYFAYLAKNVIPPKAFPLKYFSMGRQYVPAPSEEDSLFHVSQSSVVQLFGAMKNETDLDIALQELINILKETYSQFGYHFRLSYASADKLAMWESLRVIVEMYSSSLNSYVEIANVSASGDFISKRLMLTYIENKQTKFPHVISGTILNVPKLLGCVLEQDCEFSVPKQFRVENWSV